MTNFYRATYAIAAFQQNVANGTRLGGFSSNIISPEFVAGSVTTFAVSFATVSLVLVLRGLLRLLTSSYQIFFTPLNTVKPLGSVG